jgi:4-hydroxybenzoate polyprenyltransferase
MVSVYCAAGLVIYATYTIDRAMGSREDAVNKGELAGSNRRIGVTCAILMFIVGAIVLAHEGIFAAPFLPLVTGVFYSRGIRLNGYRYSLKGGAGMKNMVIGLTWGGTMAIIVGYYAGTLPGIATFMFYGIKLFCNSVIYDMKDIRGDMAAGIMTIPARYGIWNAKKMLLVPSLGLHGIMAIMILSGMLRKEWAVLAYSLLSILTVLTCYNPERELSGCKVHTYIRELFVDGESATALLIRSLLTV